MSANIALLKEKKNIQIRRSSKTILNFAPIAAKLMTAYEPQPLLRF